MTTNPSKQRGKAYALRFISGKYQGGEFPLPSEGEVVIGRSSELDMVLVEDMVSRRHSKITVTEEHIFIQDLGSTNGTFVNGEKIKRARLGEGDRILIGTSIIKLVTTEQQTNAEDARSNLKQMESNKRSSQVRTMTGSISEVPLPDLLQLFTASKKSGVLVIRTDHDEGQIFLDKGMVVYALVNSDESVDPRKAFIRILTWEEGTFDMEPASDREFENPMEIGTEALLMDAMRNIDEIRRLGDVLPGGQARLRWATPLESPLRELSPEELDVMQLVYNHEQMSIVLNKSQASDLKTSELLAKLIKTGYVVTA